MSKLDIGHFFHLLQFFLLMCSSNLYECMYLVSAYITGFEHLKNAITYGQTTYLEVEHQLRGSLLCYVGR